MQRTYGELIKHLIEIAESGNVDDYSYFMNILSDMELQGMQSLADNLSTAIGNQLEKNNNGGYFH